ncbi:MAG: hypothetical protein IJ745_00890 [Bacteroidales bacterium]|nr:hypothetical protein [Bacteroidales bacterium]
MTKIDSDLSFFLFEILLLVAQGAAVDVAIGAAWHEVYGSRKEFHLLFQLVVAKFQGLKEQRLRIPLTMVSFAELYIPGVHHHIADLDSPAVAGWFLLLPMFSVYKHTS